MIRITYTFCTLLILLSGSITSVVYSQDIPGSIHVKSLIALNCSATRDLEGTNDDNQFVFKYWYENAGTVINNRELEQLGYDNQLCFTHLSRTPIFNQGIFHHLIGPAATTNSLADSEYIPDPWNNLAELGFQGWENNAGDMCVYNGADEEGCDPLAVHLRYIEYAPEIRNFLPIRCGSFELMYSFVYSLPKPSAPPAFSGNVCDTGPLLLTTQNFLHPSYVGNGLYRFENVWEYRVGAFSQWQQFDIRLVNQNGQNGTNFNVRQWVGNITLNTDVEYRVKTRMTVLATGEVFERASDNVVIRLSPLPATIQSSNTLPSCPASATGEVTVNITGGTPDHLYSLVSGNVTGPCNADTLNGKLCGIPFFRDANNNFTFTSIAKGPYTLIVTNGGGNSGVCQSRRTVQVGELPLLTLQPPEAVDASCNGIADGKITLTSTGGVAPVQYHVTKTGFASSNETGTFDLLGAGTYVCTATDVCTQVQPVSVTIEEPLNVLAGIDAFAPLCNSPADGSVEVNVTQGEGSYSFMLSSNGQLIRSLENTTMSQWTAEDLEAGDYTIEIKDIAHPQCQGYTDHVALASPPSFQIDTSLLVTHNISCFNYTDGAIELAGVNPSQEFNYTLTALSSGQSVTSATPSFSSLQASDYLLVMRRNLTGCNDRLDYPSAITLSQPEDISIALAPHDIRCFGEDNGQIIAHVQGATPSDQYSWEFLLNGNWATMSHTETTLQNLQAGTYRMKLVNGNNCQAGSGEATIHEPALFTLENIVVKDIVCHGEPGEIETILQGGILPYTYHYSSGSTSIESASQKTALGQGTYMLIAKDANGCEVDHPEVLTITAPAAALSFTYALSDYNGFNVSCTGASDGFADLTGEGGNDATYTGYSYALNDAPFQNDPQLGNIPAGEHTLSIRDGRGCLVSRSVTFIAPPSRLEPELISKSDIKCQGDTDGKLSLHVTGGVEPYTYSLNGLTPQGTGTFSGLASGSYTISISDINGCTTAWYDQIDAIVTPIVILLTKTDVTCYGLADGTITADITGGAQPLQHQWRNASAPVSNIHELIAGTYTLSVSDEQGCAQEQSITISQPEELLMEVTTIPVCAGTDHGEIRVQARGGTMPYAYSADAGVTYRSESILKNIAAGIHNVVVKDRNNCLRETSAEIIVRNDRPKPDFIVATKENALDTLVIHEISVPKPDRLEWTFDPAIIIVKDDAWTPEITVHEPGDYTIGMTGYFGGCEYTTTLTLSINPYEPGERITDAESMAIKELTATPNPNTGVFDMHVGLPAKQRLTLSIFNITGVEHYRKTWDKTPEINESIDMSNSPAGLYIMRVTSQTDTREMRIVINPE